MSLVDSDDNPIHVERKSFFGEVGKMWAKINVEPTIFVIAVSYGVILSVLPLILFWVRCVQLFGGYTNLVNATNFCARISVLKNETYALNQVEEDISFKLTIIQILSTILSVISAPFVGAWSDRKGRKLPYICCLVSLTLYCLFHMVGIFLYDRVSFYWFYVSSEVVSGLMGGAAMSLILSVVIVTDDSREQLGVVQSGVPWRITFACLARSLGVIGGSFVYTLVANPLGIGMEKFKFHVDEEFGLFHVNGFFWSYSVAVGCAFFALCYTVFFVTETLSPMEVQISTAMEVESHEQLDYVERSSSYCGRRFMEYVKNFMQVLVVPRAGWTRFCLIATFLFMFIDWINADNSLLLMILKRAPFEWTDEVYNRYLIFKNVVTSVGVVVMPVTFKTLSFFGKDSAMVLCATIANAVYLFVIYFAETTQELFWGLFLLLLGSGTVPGFQTVLTKLVAKSETARIFSITSVIVVLCPLFSKSIFYQIYQYTLSTNARLVLLIMGVLTTLSAVGQIVTCALMYPLLTEAERKADDTLARATAESGGPSLSSTVPSSSGCHNSEVDNTSPERPNDDADCDDAQPLIQQF